MIHPATRRVRVRLPRPALFAALLTPTLVVALVACGGAPRNASAEDFCQAYFSILPTSADDEARSGADIRAWADRLHEIGTPAEIGDDARAGFETIVEIARDLDDDATAEELAAPDVAAEDQERLTEFSGFVADACAGQMLTQLEGESLLEPPGDG